MLREKKKFRNTTRVKKRLDTDQTQHFVGPDLGSNCLCELMESQPLSCPLAPA